MKTFINYNDLSRSLNKSLWIENIVKKCCYLIMSRMVVLVWYYCKDIPKYCIN